MLGVFCRRWGVPLIDGGTVRLPAIVGLGLILTGRAVPAAEALAMGLVSRAALGNEFRRGMSVLAAPGVAEQVARFTGGAGRGGTPA